MNTKHTILALFLMVISSVFAQNCDYLFDAITKDTYFITSNEITGINGNADIPVVAKYDLNGQEIWRIEDSFDANYTNLDFIELFDFSNNELYALLTILDTHQNSNSNKQIWKIDAQNGSILWKSAIYVSDRDANASLIDYDTNTFLFYNPLRNNNGGTIEGFEVFSFQKNDGAVQPIFEVNIPQKDIQIVKDSKNNLIYTYYHPILHTLTFRKINLTDFKSVIWEKDFNQDSGNATIETIEKMVIDKKDDLYLFGHNANFDLDLIKINTRDGSEIWSKNNICYDNHLSDYKLTKDYLYISLKHQFIGSVTTSFFMKKINNNTGVTEWSTQLEMDILGASNASNGTNQAIYSFDLDCNKDIFATGYYGSLNYAPGAFGVMKINGQTGAKINDITCTLNPSFVDLYSVGLKSFVINEIPYFLGNMEYDPNKSTRFIIKSDNNLSAATNYYENCGLLAEADLNLDKILTVYPNPVTDILTIKSESTLSKITILDLNGKILLTKKTDLNQINLSNIETGIYLLKIKTGNKVMIQKLVKL